MASIRKRSRKTARGKERFRYEVRYLDPAGKLRGKSFNTKAQSEDFAATVEAKKLQNEYRDPSLGRERLASYYERRWLPVSRFRLSPSTLNLMQAHWRCYVQPALGSRKMNSLTPLDLSSFVQGTAERVSVYQAETSLRLIRSILAAAVEDGVLGASPALKVTPPRRPPRNVRYLVVDEVGQLVDAHPDRWQAFVLVAAYGGLRFGELAGLCERRIDLLRRKVLVEQAIIEVSGKNYVRPTKSGKPRTVTLPSFVMDVLAEHIRKYPPNADGLVFCNEDGTPVRRSNFYKSVWWPAIKRSGIGHLRFHDLRHTSAALAIAEGAHPKTIQMRMGHHSAAFTLDVYGGLFPSLDEDLAEQLDHKGREQRITAREAEQQQEAKVIPLAKWRKSRG